MNKSEIYFYECHNLFNKCLNYRTCTCRENSDILAKIVLRFMQVFIYSYDSNDLFERTSTISIKSNSFPGDRRLLIWRSINDSMKIISFCNVDGNYQIRMGASASRLSPIKWSKFITIYNKSVVDFALEKLSDDERCWLVLNGYKF